MLGRTSAQSATAATELAEPSSEEITVEASASEGEAHEAARTLELPSVDALRERAEPAEPSAETGPRVAAGGGERAS